MKMRWPLLLLGTVAVNVCLSGGALAQTQGGGDAQPDAYTYKRVDGKEMKAYVSEPPHSEYRKPRAAMLVFHGGSRNHGSAAWTFGQARYFTSLGMVGISVDYRLANGDSVTPFDATEDARSAVRWARSQAALLNIDAKRIGAYGESAGGLLAAATAITQERPSKDELSAVPNALVLVSPALNVEKSARFLTLAGKRRGIASIELGAHVRRGLPPIIILTGALDVAVPPAPLPELCEKMRQAENRCELEIYPGLGHLLEPPEGSGTAKEEAAKTRYDAYLKTDQFLASMGFILLSKPKN